MAIPNHNLIIFDRDLTLIDSVRHVVWVYQETARRLGMNVPTEDQVLKLWGLSADRFVHKLWGNVDNEAIINQLHAVSLESQEQLFAGVPEMLRSLSLDGISFWDTDKCTPEIYLSPIFTRRLQGV